jgi:hypothetical protein
MKKFSIFILTAYNNYIITYINMHIYIYLYIYYKCKKILIIKRFLSLKYEIYLFKYLSTLLNQNMK